MRVSIGDLSLWFDVVGAKLQPGLGTMVERKTIVAIHGGPGFDHSLFRPAYDRLAEHAQVIFVDLRGHGRSDRGDATSWTIDAWADDIVSFCRALSIEDPILLGWSLGGFVALSAAIRYPDFASGLIGIGTCAHTDHDLAAKRIEELAGPEAGRAAKAFFAHPSAVTLGAFMTHCVPLYWANGTPFESLSRAISAPEPRDHFFRPGGEFKTFDYRAGLAECRTPALLLHGVADPILPVELAKETAAAFVRAPAELVVLEDCAHDVVADQPAAAFDAMVRFIERL